MGRFFLTGDTHGNFNRIIKFCKEFNTTQDDIMCILGDAGINYYLNMKDFMLKQILRDLPITLFCIRGNHEEAPYNIDSYQLKQWNGGYVYYEEQFPNLLFAMDGEIYNINEKSCLVIGGAYSVDKYYRLAQGWMWFECEQLTDKIKNYIMGQIGEHSKFDLVLTHTCPINTEPRHKFLAEIDQSKVDKSMEIFLQNVADKIDFNDWYFGHYHDNWDNGKYHMLYEGYKEIL